MTGMKIRPLGSFGVEVEGIDLSEPLGETQARTLVDLVSGEHVAVIRGQALDKASFDRFGRLWGQPIDFFFTPDLDPDYPALIRISNSPDLDVARRDGASFWHTDGSYEYLPASYTMLYGVEAPAVGGETLFADLTAAYEALPAATRLLADSLMVRHKLVGGKRGPDETPLALDPDRPDRDGGVRARKRAQEQPIHPLVLTHPITGRKGLYALAGTPFAIEGMSAAEGEALLDELKAHALQDRFIIRAKAGAGDVLIWDNLCCLHRATPLEYSAEAGKRRVLLRISTNGVPPAYAATRKPAFEARPEMGSIKFG